jgi:hypothetical protein
VAGATALARVEPRLRLPAYSLAAAICLTRPYLGMHYPSDVLAGVLLGAVVGRAVPRLGEPGVEERLMDLVARAGSSPEPSRDGGPATEMEARRRAPERSEP